MKAAIYQGKENIKIIEKEIPILKENDVLIKNIYSSICGTDVAIYQNGPNTGHRIELGQEFGHETVSRVVAIGNQVRDFSVGDRVYPYPLFVTGDTKRAGMIGAFSEYILVPNAKLNHSLYRVDNCISNKVASLIEPFTVACHAARRATRKEGENFIVFGSGTIGLASAITLQYLGAKKIVVCDISDYRLNIAKQLGFITWHVKEDSFNEELMSIFGSSYSLHGKTANIDAFIDASGASSIYSLFTDYGKIDSRFVSVAVNNNILKVNYLDLIYSSKSIIGSGGYAPEDVHLVMEIMKSNRWNIEKMITHQFNFLDLEKAIQKASDVYSSGNVIIQF